MVTDVDQDFGTEAGRACGVDKEIVARARRQHDARTLQRERFGRLAVDRHHRGAVIGDAHRHHAGVGNIDKPQPHAFVGAHADFEVVRGIDVNTLP